MCGTAAALRNDNDTAPPETMIAWMCVTVSAAVVVGWLLLSRVVLRAVTSVPLSSGDAAAVPLGLSILRVANRWSPPDAEVRYGALFDVMRSGAWWWRWALLATMTIVAGVTGAGGLRGGGCTASLLVSATLLFAAAILVAVTRPYLLPTENLLNPAKFLFLGSTSVVLLTLEGDAELAALTLLSSLQTLVMVLRIFVKVALVTHRHCCRRPSTSPLKKERHIPQQRSAAPSCPVVIQELPTVAPNAATETEEVSVEKLMDLAHNDDDRCDDGAQEELSRSEGAPPEVVVMRSKSPISALSPLCGEGPREDFVVRLESSTIPTFLIPYGNRKEGEDLEEDGSYGLVGSAAFWGRSTTPPSGEEKDEQEEGEEDEFL